MGNKTGIEWTDTTWNPIRGCSRVSEGCRHCYAERMAHRFSGDGGPYEGLTQLVNGHPTWTGRVDFVEEHLLDPLGWEMAVDASADCSCWDKRHCPSRTKRPRRIFVNSMSDLFHPNVPDEWIAKIVAVMVRAHWNTYQVLTKRPARMNSLLSSEDFWRMVDGEIEKAEGKDTDFLYNPPCAHIHWGVSVEDQATADERIPLLLQTPAAVRFISAEPLLGEINLPWPLVATHPELDWVIVGGESGPGARPMHPDWARGLRDQCVSAGVPFFFKQWGEFTSAQVPGVDVVLSTLQPGQCVTAGIRGHHTLYTRVGKKVAGSRLDGREWKEFPR